jgi:RNA:NAD 2'-phosphotransferase (TPT1/KptA family)
MCRIENHADMTNIQVVDGSLNEWSPGIRRILNNLGYLHDYSQYSDEDRSRFAVLAKKGAATEAANLWLDFLNDRTLLHASELILILEHFRRTPAAAARALRSNGMVFPNTVANVAFRAANRVYDDARSLMVRGDFDQSMARFTFSLDEFRFAIESSKLSPETSRQALGKYATAVAFSGRWKTFSMETIERALRFSTQSFELGNAETATIAYRLEILLQAFDISNDVSYLEQAISLQKQQPDLMAGTELPRADVRLRLALVSDDRSKSVRHLAAAEALLNRATTSSQFDEVRRTLLQLLAEKIRNGFRPHPTSLGIPNGLTISMMESSETNNASVVADLVDGIDSLWRTKNLLVAGVVAARLLRELNQLGFDRQGFNAAERYVEVTSWLAEVPTIDRHLIWEAGDASLELARSRGDYERAVSARDRFAQLVERYPSWPLPKIGFARALEVVDKTFNGAKMGSDLQSAAWLDAARASISSPDYQEESLGGRSKVFAVEDVRGFMSESFVFKPMSQQGADIESDMLRRMADAISQRNLSLQFAIPDSLAVIPLRSNPLAEVIHVLRRSQGVELGSLDKNEKSRHISSTLTFLSIFHLVAGRPIPEMTSWKPLKENLKLCLKSLVSSEESDSLVAQFKDALPNDLPLVMKRDAHGGNWLLDDSGRIVALDMESRGFLPLGLDVAQLIEDAVMLPVSESGWARRLEEWSKYQVSMSMVLTGEKSAQAYEWFALFRALWLGTTAEASKTQRTHGRELAAWIAARGTSSASVPASRIAELLTHVDAREERFGPISHDHRRVSRSLSYLLRHEGREVGLSIDVEGFAPIEQVAAHLNLSIEEITSVVEHPRELRFQLSDGYLRALYGHSMDVIIDSVISTESPDVLYHGSSWDHVEEILRGGIRPMSRQKVHLSNSIEEALEVGVRHGNGAVFEVKIHPSNEPMPVADGVWVTDPISPSALSLVNPFATFAFRRTHDSSFGEDLALAT